MGWKGDQWCWFCRADLQFAFDVRVPGGVVDLDVLDASVAARLWLP